MASLCLMINRIVMEDNLKKEIFGSLKLALEPFCKDQDIRTDNEKAYNVYGKKTVEVNNKTIEGQYFASAMMMKNHVGFYFFPIYTHKEEFQAEKYPLLLKCLKGKSCFHLKKHDPDIFLEISLILKQGADLYASIGWR